MASGINNTFRQVGIATGIAALGRDLPVQDQLEARRAGAEGAPSFADAVSSGATHAAVQQVPRSQRPGGTTAANQAFISGFNEILLVGGGSLRSSAAVAGLALVRSSDFVVAPDGEAPAAEPAAGLAPAPSGANPSPPAARNGRRCSSSCGSRTCF